MMLIVNPDFGTSALGIVVLLKEVTSMSEVDESSNQFVTFV